MRAESGFGKAGSGGRRSALIGLAAVLVAIACTLWYAGYFWQRSTTMVQDHFRGRDGLITNEFAYHNPADAQAIRSASWWVTSGSLFRRHGVAWSGIPDVGNPGVDSSKATNSSVFRMVTARNNIDKATVHVKLRVLDYVAAAHGDRAWDGFHIFLRYQDQTELYVISVVRRDGSVAIKKKMSGGSDNGGSYVTLASTSSPAVTGRWLDVRASVRNVAASTELSLVIDGHRLLSVRDVGTGGAPITSPGRIGFRGDNCQFELASVEVTSR